MQKRSWTKRDDQILTDLWPVVSVKTIADKLDRSRNAVIGRADRIGLPLHKNMSVKKASIEEIESARRDGMSWHGVATEFGYASSFSANSTYLHRVTNAKT